MRFAESTATEKSVGAFGGQKAIAAVGLIAVNYNGFILATLKCLCRRIGHLATNTLLLKFLLDAEHCVYRCTHVLFLRV